MVFRVCQRVLQHGQDAEDVFQATFLTLARRAGSIRRQNSVASWLYGVASFLARRAQTMTARRRLHESQAIPKPPTDLLSEITLREAQQLLDEELAHLPDKLRAPLVLCYLESSTRDEAAQQLGLSLGTLKRRLEQGRERLRRRLTQRGLTLSSTLLAATLTQRAADAGAPAGLSTATTKAALLYVTNEAASLATLSSPVISLLRGVTQAMFLSKLKVATAVLLAVCLCATTAGLLLHQVPAAPGPEPGFKGGIDKKSPSGAAAKRPAEVNNNPGDKLIQDSNGAFIPDLYRDMTPQSGINFLYRNGQEANHYAILESLGGGVALLDYDGDGLLDIFVTGGGYYEGAGDAKDQIKGHGCRLYKNLGNWKFRDVTKEVGLEQALFYSHGVAVADYDCDGWPDLLVTGWGRMALYHNVPVDPRAPAKGRRFVEVTKEAGLMKEPLWTTSAAWADLDGDGFPDLYVCQYVNWSLENNPFCRGYTSDVDHDVCPPKMFQGLPHKVFRNNGNGTFTDVSKEAGLRLYSGDATEKPSDMSKGLGVVVVDVNDDGKPDIYVANDTVDNFLYLNKSTPGKIRLEEVGLPTGTARDDRGVPNGSMGVAAADYDGSGRASLWCTNYENEMHALYKNQGGGMFLFSTPAAGIAAIGQQYVGFGTGFLDVDNDGWEDLVITNGHVIRHPKQAGLQQRPVLLRNLGKGRFADITIQGGDYFRAQHMGRGLVIGDLDNDGRPDLVISHLNEPVALLRNQAGVGQHWLGVELVGDKHRDIVGAKVIVEVGGRKLTRFTHGGGSYLSSGDRRMLFGLGKAARIDRLTVIWKPGQEQHWTGEQLKADQ
jgi:RNA polymerase sigma factor (sigma-70 family)